MDEQSQNPGEATAENSTVSKTPAPQAQSAPESPTVPHEVYAGLQRTLNKRNQEFEALAATFAAEQEARRQAEEMAAQRMKKLGEQGAQLEKYQAEFSAAQKRLMKIDAFNQLMNDPESGLTLSAEAKLKLFGLLDKLPAGEDLESTMSVIKEFAAFGQEVANERRKKESAGATPGMAGLASDAPQYATLEEWAKAAETKKPDDLAFWAAYESFVNSKS